MSEIKPSTVAEIKAQPEDSTVYRFIGAIKKRFKRTEGENSKGPYSFEHLEIADATGTLIKVSFKDCPPLDPSFVAGKRLSILAQKSEQHGWKGVKAKDDTYKEKTSRILWVTPSAVVTLLADLSATAEQPGKTDERRSEKPDSRRQPEPKSGDPVKDAMTHISKILNLQRFTLRATNHLSDEWREAYDEEMPLELFQSINAQLFIESSRAGRHLDLPTTPISLAPPKKGTQ